MTNMKRKNNAWSGIGTERRGGSDGKGTEPVTERSTEKKVGDGVGDGVEQIGDAERKREVYSCLLLERRCLTYAAGVKLNRDAFSINLERSGGKRREW